MPCGSGSTWRNGRFIGDSGTQAHVLEALTKEDPQRFARLLLRIPTGTADAYVSAILRGLTDARVDLGQLLDVCRHAVRLGGDDDVTRWLVYLIEAHAGGPLDDELIEMIAAVARGEHSTAPLGTPGNWEGGDDESAALHSTRGAAALAIGRLLREQPSRLRLVEPALRRLAVDAQSDIRAAAVAALAPLLHSDPDLAVDLFHEAVNLDPGQLLGGRDVDQFLRAAVHARRYSDVAPLLTQMLSAPDHATRRAAARWRTLAAYYDPSLDSEVDVLLTGADGATRAAAVEVFADNITYEPRLERTIAVLSAALDDADRTSATPPNALSTGWMAVLSPSSPHSSLRSPAAGRSPTERQPLSTRLSCPASRSRRRFSTCARRMSQPTGTRSAVSQPRLPVMSCT